MIASPSALLGFSLSLLLSRRPAPPASILPPVPTCVRPSVRPSVRPPIHTHRLNAKVCQCDGAARRGERCVAGWDHRPRAVYSGPCRVLKAHQLLRMPSSSLATPSPLTAPCQAEEGIHRITPSKKPPRRLFSRYASRKAICLGNRFF